MNPLAQHLLELSRSLEPALGTSADVISALLKAQAASAIQQDSTQAVPSPDVPPAIADAIKKGAEQAEALTAAGVHLAVEMQEVPLGISASSSTTEPSEVFGPFVERSGRLVQFSTFQSGAFLSVNLRSPSAPIPVDLWLLIPAASVATAADNRTWNLPAGTVWIRSRFLVPDAPGFAGLRVAKGTLQFDRPVEHAGNRILVPNLAVWSLSVEPEQPAPVGPAGTDADGAALVLPSRLDVHSNTAPLLTGIASLSGFGSDLHFTPWGAPSVHGQEIRFSLKAVEPDWAIDGNRSAIVQLSGHSSPDSTSWALPVSIAAQNLLGEVLHGGSLLVSLGGPFAAALANKQSGSLRCFVNTLTVNARVLEFESLQIDSKGRYDFELWEMATSALRFAEQAVRRFLFRSERGGSDAAMVLGGKWTNKWDLPRRADGKPFAFEGAVDLFALLSGSAGVWVLCAAAGKPPAEIASVALENLYLTVRPPGKLFFLAHSEAAPALPAGTALLFFDVNLAIPTLPDPYAANLGIPKSDTFAANAMRIELRWTDSETPALAAHLDSQVQFPEPRFLAPDDPEENRLEELFRRPLAFHPEFLYLLDLSSRDHLFGVALESPSDTKPEIVGNRLSVPLQRIRLLMQPQVQWEPVFIRPNDDNSVPGLRREYAKSYLNGGPTLVGASSVTLVPVLPGLLSREIVRAIDSESSGAALFSLPFGLRAVAKLNRAGPAREGHILPGTDAALHEPAFEALNSTRQVRLTARNTTKAEDLARFMPGMMQQIRNFVAPPGSIAPPPGTRSSTSGLDSVVPNELTGALNGQFADRVPLHRADLSGYGLSTFSEWRSDKVEVGFSKAHFEVLNGRTALEVLQFRSVLYECGAPVVRTVILERRNSGTVLRVDTGWVAVGPGSFVLPKPDGAPDLPCERGAVKSFQNIRRIRIVSTELIDLISASVQPVLFDADAEIDGVVGGGPGGLVPFFDRPGYVQIRPPDPPPPGPVAPLPVNSKAGRPLTAVEVAKLFHDKGPISSPIDCVIRAGKTLETQLSSLVSDTALDDENNWGFAVAVLGTNRMPHAAHWNVVRIDPATGEVTQVDQHRGAPLVRKGADPFRFREPSDARRTNAAVEYGFLMATDTSRVLFRAPKLDPSQAGRIFFDRSALLADPYSLVQSAGAFPRANLSLELKEIPVFRVTSDNLWRIDAPAFRIAVNPDSGLLKGGAWGVNRNYPKNDITLDIDSGAAKSFDVGVAPSDLTLNLPAPLGDILKITADYTAAAGGLPKLNKPTVAFAGALEELTNVLKSLSELTSLPFNFDVSVTTGGGPTPSFIVHMHLLFRVGSPEERIDIGVGKFYGQFLVDGALEAALTGVSGALLFIEFRGDVQQGIIPPLLYAGGLFRFSIEIHATGKPVIQLTLGVVASIGGDLIPGIISLEVTVDYGYTLIPETLQPGVLLGLEARAKLLGGVVGFSFSVEAMARIQRVDGANVDIWAQIHIAASVQVAIFIEEPVDFETQFEQKIPLAVVAAAVFAPALLPAAAAL